MNPERTTLVRARFGLPIHESADEDRYQSIIAQARLAAKKLSEQLQPGHISLITGPSGSGKSLIVGQLQLLTPRPIVTNPIPKHSSQPVVELFDAPLEHTTHLLSICGLADARQLITPAGALSEGQRARLSLALALHRAIALNKPCTIIADEFASTLDRTTAHSLAACVRKHIARPTRFVAATAHDDIIEPLAPDSLMYTPLEGQPELLRRDETCRPKPGRSHPPESATDSEPSTQPCPGRSASAREPNATTTAWQGSTTEPAPRRRSRPR